MSLTDSNPSTWLPLDTGGARKAIDHTHSKIHDGNHFTCNSVKTMDTVTAHTMVLTAPASSVGFIHVVVGVEATAAGVWTLSIAPETSGGSALTAYNNKRNSTTTSGTTIKANVTWTSAGTVLETHYIGANNPASKTGGEAEQRNEYILNPSTSYGIRFTNNAATTYSGITTYFYLGAG